MAARGDENSIMVDIVIDMSSEGGGRLRYLQVVVEVTAGRMMNYVTGGETA